jgi:hypothetical protein
MNFSGACHTHLFQHGQNTLFPTMCTAIKSSYSSGVPFNIVDAHASLDVNFMVTERAIIFLVCSKTFAKIAENSTDYGLLCDSCRDYFLVSHKSPALRSKKVTVLQITKLVEQDGIPGLF